MDGGPSGRSGRAWLDLGSWSLSRHRSRASDLVAPAMFDFSIMRRGKARPPRCRLPFGSTPTRGLTGSLLTFIHPCWGRGGRDNSSLVWSDISPYNLRPYRNSHAFGWFKSQKMTKNVIPKQWRECMSKKSESSPTTRRKFLGGAAVATAATVAAPGVVSAQGPISMRWQSTWPSKDIFHEYALDFGKKVNDMTGGDLKIEVAAGHVV